MNKEQLQELLHRHHLKPNFTYGQNFLIDEIILQDMVDAAGVGPTDAVLEIGPGICNLTKILAERAGYLLSVEKDPKFVPILHNLKKDFRKNFRFEIADALEFDFLSALEEGAKNKIGRFDSYKVVANIPYYITGKILQMLMTVKVKPTSITVLTQKEVARNVCAQAGDLSVLAISVQLYGTPELVQIVPARSFYPAPKVDSAILKITLGSQPEYKLRDEKKFFKIVKACFAGKRKQIHNTLVNNLGLEKQSVGEILAQLKINPASRPQELSISQWIELTDKILN